MRISSGYQYDTFQADIQTAQERLFMYQQQISSGKRINKPSDDPLGTARALKMRSLKSGVEQYQANLATAKGELGYTESALGDITDLLNQANQLAVSGANSATDQAARNGMATQITGLQQRLVQLANTQGLNGAYIFAGQKNSAQPYTVAGSVITYNGDSNDVVAETSPTDTMVMNTQGEPMVSDIYKRLETLKNNLLGGNTGAISGVSLTEIQSSLKTVIGARGAVGSKLKAVDDLTTQYTRRVDDLTQGISDVEDVDMSQAIMSYQQAQAAYQGALTVASHGFSTSLMDFIKG